MMPDWMTKSKLLGRLAVFWAGTLITVVTLKYVTMMGQVTMADATIISSGVVSLFGSAVALLKLYGDN